MLNSTDGEWHLIRFHFPFIFNVQGRSKVKDAGLLHQNVWVAVSHQH